MGDADYSLQACEYQSDLTLTWASIAFLIGSLILWYEAINKYPVEVDRSKPRAPTAESQNA